jgi:hypothetical protein
MLLVLDVVSAHGVVILQTVSGDPIKPTARHTEIENIKDLVTLRARLSELALEFFPAPPVEVLAALASSSRIAKAA